MVSLHRWDWHQVSQDTFPSANAMQACSDLAVPIWSLIFATAAKRGASFSLTVDSDFSEHQSAMHCAEIHQTYFK